MSDTKRTVYVIELAEIGNDELKAALVADGFDVVSYETSEKILNSPADSPPDLIILSLQGDQDGGSALCRDLRRAYPQSGICLIHDDLSEWEESVALELGADAVLARPAAPRRILAQVRALLRRQGGQPSARLQLMAGTRMVEVGGQSILLTDAEFELMSLLAGKPGVVVSRDRISQHLSGLAYDGCNRAIDLRVARIRLKLGDDARRPTFIRTVRGEGYMLMTDDT